MGNNGTQDHQHQESFESAAQEYLLLAMAKKILTVVGATGVQGGSVVDALLASDTYALRALTRNPESKSGQALAAKGIEVVKADAGDLESLVAAFRGSHAIYAVSDFVSAFNQGRGAEYAMELEVGHGINLAKAAAATSGLHHYIWSTLPNSKELTGGKVVVPHLDSKNQVDVYIKSKPELLAKTTFFVPSFYGENIYFPMMSPIEVPGTGQYIQLHCTPLDSTFLALGHARTNIGLFVRAILEQPAKTLPAKMVVAGTEMTSLRKYLEIWSQVHGKPAHHAKVDRKAYDKLFPHWGEEIAIMMDFFEVAGEDSWFPPGALGKDDLGIEGLVDLAEALKLPSPFPWSQV
jgi:hypothetical protein